jgi:hypothetical protein
VSDSPICPECGAALAARPRRVGRLIICPVCCKPVSPAAASPADATSERSAGAVRGAASRKAPPSEPRGGSRRAAATLWTIEDPEGICAETLTQAALDEQVRSGQIDARTLLKRHDWPSAKTAAELYQGLAEPIDGAPPDRLAGSPFPIAAGPAAPPWARLPEPVDPPLPRRRRSVDRWTILKFAILVVAGLCGFWAFFRALGSFVLQPAIPRRVLFALYAGYWLGTALVAAALFNGWAPSADGEPEGLHRRFGGRRTRWLLAVGGVSIMLLVLWLVW